jgi:hypothetical protein
MDIGGWGHAMVNELGLAPPATFPVSTMFVSGKYIFLYTCIYICVYTYLHTRYIYTYISKYIFLYTDV